MVDKDMNNQSTVTRFDVPRRLPAFMLSLCDLCRVAASWFVFFPISIAKSPKPVRRRFLADRRIRFPAYSSFAISLTFNCSPVACSVPAGPIQPD
ncbi:MAG: hypothetical protein IPK83_00410 [Planctomycetes bacterium]|nr:hypothetical protein [Planctomycetota bacterium]